jgi:hypothetical protein
VKYMELSLIRKESTGTGETKRRWPGRKHEWELLISFNFTFFFLSFTKRSQLVEWKWNRRQIRADGW